MELNQSFSSQRGIFTTYSLQINKKNTSVERIKQQLLKKKNNIGRDLTKICTLWANKIKANRLYHKPFSY